MRISLNDNDKIFKANKSYIKFRIRNFECTVNNLTLNLYIGILQLKIYTHNSQ